MMYYGVTLPMQVVPSPVYPWLHLQVKFSGVLKHVALESQLLVAHLSVHIIKVQLINGSYYFYFPPGIIIHTVRGIIFAI